MVKLGIKGMLVLLSVVNVSQAVADQFHYNNMLIEHRASGMAGAYTAISDDAAGLFYNPAGIVFSNDLQLSASANAIHSSTLKYKGVLRGGDWVRKSSSFIPNYFGITSRFGDGYIGFSYAVTDSDVEDQDSVFTSIPGISLYTININNNDNTMKVGPSYARQVTDNLNFGITLYFYEREKETISSQWIRLADSTYEWSNLYSESDEEGIEPIIGIMWSPNDSLSFGFSLRKVLISSSSSRIQTTCASNVNEPANQSVQCIPVAGVPVDPTISISNEKRELPLNIRVGVAYFPTDRLMFGADLSHFEAVRSSGFDAEETINFALGIEYYLNARWALRGGFYTNNANTPSIIRGDINQAEHVDLKGLSVSISHFTKSSSVTLGMNYSSGNGNAQVIASSTEIQDLEQSTQSVYLSTSYRF